jgi:four helix bundle protein
MQQTSFFPHETLRAYQQAVQVSRWVSAARFPRGMAWVKDQAQRAAGSVALNIAEGRGRAGQAQRNHYEIAYASASEACAALDLVDLPGAAEKQQELRAIGSMLVGMMR